MERDASRNVTNLVEFQAHQTRDEGSCGGDGRNDLAGNLLRRVAVGGLDVVIRRTQIRSSSDEVDVVVRIIVLLELNRVQAVADKR